MYLISGKSGMLWMSMVKCKMNEWMNRWENALNEWQKLKEIISFDTHTGT